MDTLRTAAYNVERGSWRLDGRRLPSVELLRGVLRLSGPRRARLLQDGRLRRRLSLAPHPWQPHMSRLACNTSEDSVSQHGALRVLTICRVTPCPADLHREAILRLLRRDKAACSRKACTCAGSRGVTPLKTRFCSWPREPSSRLLGMSATSPRDSASRSRIESSAAASM